MHSKKLSGTDSTLGWTEQHLTHELIKQHAGVLHDGDAGALASSSLLSEITHEFRTPLNGVLGMLELLLDSPLTGEQRDAVVTARASAEDVMSVFSNVMDLPMMEIGVVSLREKPFDLNREIGNWIESLNIHARLHNAALDCHYKPDRPLTLVAGDAERIRQAFFNIVKYLIRQGGRQIRIELRHWPDVDGTVTVSMTAETTSAAVAARFSDEVDDGTSRQFDAAELGLIVCKKLVEMMSGELGIDYDEHDHVTVTASISVMQTPNVLDGVRVLMAGETAEHRSLLQAVLSSQGMRVDCVNTASEALDALTRADGKGDPYSVILLDQHLRGMDGEMFGNAVISEPAYRNVHPILISDADPQRIRKAGFSALLSWPADTQAALDTVLLLLGTRKTGHAPPFIVDGVPQSPDDGNRPFAGRRVLVADDNPVNLRIARHMLEQLGCTVRTADDGAAAVARCEEGEFDLILMDCEMPVMDGYEATSRIRKQQRDGARTVIVAWTARGAANEPQRSIDGGFDDFLAKPAGQQELHDLLAGWLKESPQAAQAPAAQDEFEDLMETFGDGFAELVDLFHNDSPKRIVALHTAAAESDTTQVARIAHAFCGSCASIGAVGLSTLCREIETDARKGRIDDIGRQLNAVEREYERVQARLQSLISSHAH